MYFSIIIYLQKHRIYVSVKDSAVKLILLIVLIWLTKPPLEVLF